LTVVAMASTGLLLGSIHTSTRSSLMAWARSLRACTSAPPESGVAVTITSRLSNNRLRSAPTPAALREESSPAKGTMMWLYTRCAPSVTADRGD